MPLSTFILSELYRGGIAYGRELQRRFEAAGIPSWASVSHSSVYRALAALERKGLVARYRPAARPSQRGRAGGAASAGRSERRNRKFYAITARGRKAFEAGLSGELAEPRTYRNSLNIAVHCLRALPRGRAVALLEERRERLSLHEGEADLAARRARRGGRAAAYERLAAERVLMKTRAELFFAASLADYLRAGG